MAMPDESPLVEFARRAIDSYVLMFPDDPKVIRWKEAWAELDATIEKLWPDAD